MASSPLVPLQDSHHAFPVSQSSAFQVYASTLCNLKNTPLFLVAQQAMAQQGPALPLPVAVLSPTPATLSPPPPSPPLAPDSGASSGHTEALGAGEVAEASLHRVAGIKLPVTCNDVRGVVHLDQQVVSCFCATCSARVADGHDRPLFSFTRFERHTGSKAKKWRLSLRIDPGVVRECPIGDPPLPLGAWLDARGVAPWNQRAPLHRLPAADSDSDEATGGSGRYQRQAAVVPLHGGDCGWAGDAGAVADPAPRSAAQLPPPKRERCDDAGPPGEEAGAEWLAARLAAFEAAAAGHWRERHAAIFHLVYGVLQAAGAPTDFSEHYMPWLNDLGLERLDHEFQTLANYLTLSTSGVRPAAVQELIRAYIWAIVARVMAAARKQ